MEKPSKGPRQDTLEATPFQYVDTRDKLETLAEHLASIPRFAVDLEGDSFYHYYDKVCLLQISTEDADYIVDPLRARDLSALRPVFAAPEIEKVFHAAVNDLANLSLRHDIRIKGLFDTHVAAQVLGHRRLGLANLLEHYFGVTLEKRFQRYDWSRRPLRPEHLAYARRDTHYLLRLRDALWSELETAGRTAQAREEIGLLELREPQPRVFSPDDCMRIRGARDLDPDGKRVLRSLFVSRDREARRRDVPPFRVLSNDALIALARERPLTDDALKSLSGLPRHLSPALRSILVLAIESGLEKGATTQEPWPPAPHPVETVRDDRPRRKDPAVLATLARLKTWRAKQADKENMPPDVVATTSQLQALATKAPRNLEALARLPDIRQWQVERYGTEWLHLLARGQDKS